MTILWWVLGVVGALLLLLLLWLGYQVIRFRRYESVIFEYLAFQDAEEAGKYIEEHPLLLTDESVNYIQLWLNRAWGRGDVHKFVSYVPHMKLLVSCQKYGTETIRGSEMMDDIQSEMNAAASPSWQRAMDVLKELTTEGDASIPPEEADEELVEAIEQIMELLRPLAVDDETRVLQDEIVRMMRRMLEQKDK